MHIKRHIAVQKDKNYSSSLTSSFPVFMQVIRFRKSPSKIIINDSKNVWYLYMRFYC